MAEGPRNPIPGMSGKATALREFLLAFILLLLTVLIIAGAYHLPPGMGCHDRELITVSTDRQEYSAGDQVQVRILNNGSRPVDIYCPSWCALGNFPTAVEQLGESGWEYSLGFCPSIGSPLENRGTIEGKFVRHTLSPGGSFRPVLSNLGALRLEKPGRFRIVYYLCGGREPVYSNPFAIVP